MWLAVDADGEWLFLMKPEKNYFEEPDDYYWVIPADYNEDGSGLNTAYFHLHDGECERLIGKALTINDDPVEI